MLSTFSASKTIRSLSEVQQTNQSGQFDAFLLQNESIKLGPRLGLDKQWNLVKSDRFY